jgi:hypothetical protein
LATDSALVRAEDDAKFDGFGGGIPAGVFGNLEKEDMAIFGGKEAECSHYGPA